MRSSSKPLRDEEEFKKAEKKLHDLFIPHFRSEIDLYFFDETGFSLQPSVPYGWAPEGEVIEIPSQRSKRLNVLGFWGPEVEFVWEGHVGSVDSDVVIATMEKFCKGLERETTVVLDNAPTHTSKKFRAEIPSWRARGLNLFYLPTYSPELNWIEMLWRKIKYQWLPISAYQTVETLFAEVARICDSINVSLFLNTKAEDYA